MRVDLRLNFIPITFSNKTFKGYEIAYIDDDNLRELRNKYSSTHVLRRKGKIIQCVPVTDSAEVLSEERSFNVKDDFQLARYLVQSALTRVFRSKNLSFTKLFNPTKFVLENENLMREVLGAGETSSLLPLYPEYKVESTTILPHRKPAIFGILVKYSVKRLIEATVEELIKKNIDVQNLYITADSKEVFAEKIIDAKYRRELAGKIIGIKDSKLKLTDFSDKDEVDAKTCYLEPSPMNFKHCLASMAPKEYEQTREKIAEQIFKVKGAKNQHERLQKFRDWLSQLSPISCSEDLSFTIMGQIYRAEIGTEAGEYKQLTTPDYVLRPGGSITVKGRIDDAIEEKGPFDTESFPRKRIRMAVIFPRRYKGEVEVFVRQFRDGVVPKTQKKIPFTQGFTRKYHLTGCEFDFYQTDDNEDSKGFKNASLEALRNPKGHDLAIVVIKEDFHNLHGEENPYIVAKSTFMSQGIPVQEIEIETIRDERGRPWILNNMALAIYAKLGGIPWVLSSTQSMTHELIFGIGNSRIQTQRLSEGERIVGITTVFNGDGNYLLYNLSRDVPYEEYQTALLQSLKDCLNEIKARYAWQSGDNVRLIFHQSFKKYRDEEAKAVKTFVETITDFNVEYAFVHISTGHQWTMFDAQSEGTEYWEHYKKLTKGQYVPYRGYSIPLGPRAALLTLTGPQQLKTHLQGCPDPILISIHQESTFTSQEYLISQIFKLTFMSWKSFFPSTMPVTISYSDMIAHLMGLLRPLQNWNPEILSTKLRESRWFL